MKKRDLLLAGLFLFSVSAFAQPGVDEPQRYNDDAKVIFTQDFEGSAQWEDIDLNLKPAPGHPDWHIPLHTWNIKPVDSIMHVEYYAEPSDKGQWKADIYDGSASFEIAGIRDTVMMLYDGVVKTDASFADDSCLQWDKFYIQEHDNLSQHGETGVKGLDAFGENGGEQYFRYVSRTSRGLSNRGGGSYGSHDEASTSQDHYSPEYRRNLFVRNIPIEDSSSYRVTVFVRPTLDAVTQKGVKARLGLELMRGYFHSEKSFQVNREGDSKVAFADKTDYTSLNVGEWNKITLMAYYTNDSLGDASAYDQTYYWNTDWDWKVPVSEGKVVAESTDSATLRYIKQPDKFFVRMSFRSDSTTFDVDNLTLTKSWIGGVEYYSEMIRVDMGYQTNLGDLAQKALEENKIDAVELPGKYFDVWGRWEDDHHWEQVPILSAEYHGDGYMYMWTEPEDGVPFTLDVYDSLLVSFTNPSDPALQLKYTGDRYPNGMNKEWIADKDKRVVFDFHNEIAYLNPTIMTSPVTGKSVRSLAELTPVLQKETIVDGAFGLASDTREMTFKFSKNLSFDNIGATSNKTTVTLTGNGVTEYWTIKEYPEDAKGFTTIERPAEYTTPLQGDYVLNFRKVTHLKNPNPERTEDYGDPVTINYHFGEFDTTTRLEGFDTNWDVKENEAEAVCFGTAIIDSNTKNYKEGDGKKGAGSRMYRQSPKGQFSCSYYLSPRGTSVNGQLYIGTGDDRYSINLSAGIDYKLTFMALGWDNKAQTNVYIFPKPVEGTPADVKTEDKTKLGEFTPTNSVPNAEGRKTTYVVSTADTLNYFFTVPADGKYIVEFEMPSSANWTGTLYSDIHITDANDTHVGDLSDVSVSRINKALDNAYKAIQAAEPAKYQGTDLENLIKVKANSDGFIAAKKATNLNLPSEYEEEAQIIDAATSALKLHMDTVDAFNKALADAQAKLDLYDADTLKAYKNLVVVGDLQTAVTRFDGYDFSAQAPGQINADTKILLDAIKAVEDRQALNYELNDTKTAASAVLLANAKYSAVAAYVDLEDAIASANAFDAIAAVDEEINSTISALSGAMRPVKLLSFANVITKRITALNSLATSLGVEFDSDTKTRIADAVIDDDELADLMKTKITEAIYNRVNDGNNRPLDLSAFIKNYYLYATPILNEVGSVTKDNDGNTLKNAKIVTPGAQIQHIEHRWNTNQVWGVILDVEFDNLYPGWSFTADNNGGSGNRYVTPDDEGYPTFTGEDETKYLAFDGQLAMDWNSKAEMKQVVTGLPIGTYSLGINLKNNGKPGSTSLTAIVGEDTYKGTNPSGTGVFSVDSILVGAEGVMAIDFILASGDNWSKADDFSLTFTPLEGFDYSTVATVVDFAQAEAAGEYEYYTLTWIKVEAPEKGQVYFRKSGNVVEKIIFK